MHILGYVIGKTQKFSLSYTSSVFVFIVEAEITNKIQEGENWIKPYKIIRVIEFYLN